MVLTKLVHSRHGYNYKSNVRYYSKIYNRYTSTYKLIKKLFALVEKAILYMTNTSRRSERAAWIKALKRVFTCMQ